jgi:hypothetical protein
MSVAALDQAIEDPHEAPDVGEVEAGGRLVEHVDGGLVGHAGGQLARELEALRLAARQRVRPLADREEAAAELGDRAEGPGDLPERREDASRSTR